MASGLGAGLLALAKGRQGYNQGKDQQSQRESQVKRQQDQERRVILELALEEAGRQRSQANADRSFKLETDKFEFSKRPRPDEGPSWQTQETANGIVQVNPKTGEVRPLQLGQSPLKPKQQKWEVYGPGGPNPGEPSAGVERREEMAGKFADMYMEAYGGDVKRALSAINGTPAEIAKAKSLGMTFTHWRAAKARRDAKAAKDAGKIDY